MSTPELNPFAETVRAVAETLGLKAELKGLGGLQHNTLKRAWNGLSMKPAKVAELYKQLVREIESRTVVVGTKNGKPVTTLEPAAENAKNRLGAEPDFLALAEKHGEKRPALRSIRNTSADDSTETSKHLHSDETENLKAIERKWQLLLRQPLRGIRIHFLLKTEVGQKWFAELLSKTRVSFARHEESLKLGDMVAKCSSPNKDEHPADDMQPVYGYWQLYRHEPGYWVKRMQPEPPTLTTVAGVDFTIPWRALGVSKVANLADLASLSDVGISISAQAYQVGIEDFVIQFMGDGFRFQIKMSDHALDALHEFAFEQHKITGGEDPMPLGTSFSGVQLLELFFQQMLPSSSSAPPNLDHVFGGMSGPNGHAISFYPGMPRDFMKSEEAKLYTFTITVPAKPDTKARIKQLKERIDAEPRNGELRAELAAVYQYEGRLLEALNCLEAAMKDIPGSADVHGVHGETLAQLGRCEEAISHLEKAIQLGPKNKARLAAAHTAIGMCLHELGQTEGSLSHFQKAAKTVPDASNHHSNLGLTFVRLKRYRDAIKSYSRAVELDASIAKNYFYLGIIHEIEGRTRDAVNQFQKAVEIAPDDADALELLGQHAAKLGEHDRAISALRESIKIEKSERRLSVLGASLAAQERWSEAEPLFREARDLAPRSFDVLRNLAVCLVQQERVEEAIRLFEGALNEPTLRDSALECIEQLRAVLRGDLRIG